MITANEKYQAKWTAPKIFIMKCFHLTLRITKSCCRAARRCQMTNLRCITIQSAQTLVSQQVPCLGETDYGEKGQRNFMQSTGRRYLAMKGKQLRRETTIVNERMCSTLQSKKKRGCKGRKQESRPYSNQERGTYISCYRQAQIFCFAGLYTGASDGPTSDQVRGC